MSSVPVVGATGTESQVWFRYFCSSLYSSVECFQIQNEKKSCAVPNHLSNKCDILKIAKSTFILIKVRHEMLSQLGIHRELNPTENDLSDYFSPLPKI